MTQIFTYDFTLPQDSFKHNDIIDSLYPMYIKKYSFQLEKSDSGYIHFQGRFSLLKKRRPNEAITLFKPLFEKIHLSPSSTNSLKECFYVLKADTRIDGPWCDTDEKIYIPRQIREIQELRPWQSQLIDKSKVWNTRNIDIVIDNNGNIGKSTLATYLGVHKLGRVIPYCNDYKDLLRMTYDMPVTSCYIIDMPRAISKDKLYQFYSAIETIKSGYCYDDRYSFKERYFDCPNIWVFTNTIPDETLLSKDRWRFWEIQNNSLIMATINRL